MSLAAAFAVPDVHQLLDDLVHRRVPDERGRFGPFGGAFVPESLVQALAHLTRGAQEALSDADFRAHLDQELQDAVGRPTPLTPAPNLGRELGLNVFLKREDLAHTGAHKINNALGQALLAKRLGARRVVAETGAGQHGVATAAACARVGLPCTVYMGAVDVERQAPNVARMRLLGADVVSVTTGEATLRAAIDEAMRAWVADPEDTYYLLGSALGPHPYPWLVREFQKVIGDEARAQVLDRTGALPDVVVACVGGGSNAIGLFHAFVPDSDVELVGVEAGGSAAGDAATLTRGRPGVLHGSYGPLLQGAHGQIHETHSVSAGLDYPGVGPEHALLQLTGRARYLAVDDEQALAALSLLCRTEGILPALESSHALAALPGIAAERPGATVVLGLSGRGDKDLPTLVPRVLGGGA